MNSDFHSDLIGDKFVHHLHIDFLAKETVLILGWHTEEEIIFRYVVKFYGVVLQDVSGIQPHNILWGIEKTNQYTDFEMQERDYLVRMNNYFIPGFLEKIQRDTSLNYFFLTASTGLSGFIICKEATMTTEQV